MIEKIKKTICRIKCPYCSKPIKIIKETEIFSPAVKADKEEIFIAEKSSQITL